MINSLLNTIFQIIVFSIIPFIYFCFNRNKNKKYYLNFGLVSCQLKYIYWAFIIAFPLSVTPIILYYTNNNDCIQTFFNIELSKITLNYSLLESFILIVIYSFFKTGFCEELFFRGFIGKLLRKKFSFNLSNIIQSNIFALLHLFLILLITNNILLLIFSYLYPLVASMIGFYLNENNNKKSILPSIILHSTSNFIFLIFIYLF